MFRKVLSSIGIGAARIDLVLNKTRIAAGETITGQLKVEGGIIDQKVENVYLKLVMTSTFKKDDRIQTITREFDHETISGSFLAKTGTALPVEQITYTVPENIPISAFPTRYYFVTGLDISSAVNPTDHDLVEILPGKRQAIVMQAIEKDLGFRRKQRTGEFNGRFQEFEYRPGNFMSGRLDELEVVYLPEKGGIRLYLQIDKRARGLMSLIAENWDMDERNVQVFIPDAQLTTSYDVAQSLANFLENEYRKII